MKFLFTIVFNLVILIGFTQTKKISFESHSGHAANFSNAMKEGLTDMEESNFGVLPVREVKTAQLDSVIFLSDTSAIMVTSNFCITTDRGNGTAIGNPKLWNAGRQVVIRHPLFSKKHSLDSIKDVIAREYYFKNTIDKVVFVGYDNKNKEDKKNELVPINVTTNGNGPSSFQHQFLILLGWMVSLSLVAIAIIFQLFRNKENRQKQLAILQTA